jgi:hypothetical protein
VKVGKYHLFNQQSDFCILAFQFQANPLWHAFEDLKRIRALDNVPAYGTPKIDLEEIMYVLTIIKATQLAMGEGNTRLACFKEILDCRFKNATYYCRG